MSILARLVGELNAYLNPVVATTTTSQEPIMTNAVETAVENVITEVKTVVENVVAKVEGKQTVANLITLQDLQSTILTAHLTDVASNDAAVTDVPVWSSSNAAVVSVSPTDATGLSAKVTAGSVGNATVSVTYKNLSFTYNFAVVNGQPVSLTVSASAIIAYVAAKVEAAVTAAVDSTTATTQAPVAAAPVAPVAPVFTA
jgi:hypothetical protein